MTRALRDVAMIGSRPRPQAPVRSAFCPRCGTGRDKDYRYCARCGFDFWRSVLDRAANEHSRRA
jgi:predicted amidophosphoribosyltransferase